MGVGPKIHHPLERTSFKKNGIYIFLSVIPEPEKYKDRRLVIFDVKKHGDVIKFAKLTESSTP